MYPDDIQLFCPFFHINTHNTINSELIEYEIYNFIALI